MPVASLIDFLQSHVDNKSASHSESSHGWSEAFNQVQLGLECMPLMTEEFALAMNRLRNAAEYLTKNEPGAAIFELKLLLGSLTQGPN